MTFACNKQIDITLEEELNIATNELNKENNKFYSNLKLKSIDQPEQYYILLEKTNAIDSLLFNRSHEIFDREKIVNTFDGVFKNANSNYFFKDFKTTEQLINTSNLKNQLIQHELIHLRNKFLKELLTARTSCSGWGEGNINLFPNIINNRLDLYTVSPYNLDDPSKIIKNIKIYNDKNQLIQIKETIQPNYHWLILAKEIQSEKISFSAHLDNEFISQQLKKEFTIE